MAIYKKFNEIPQFTQSGNWQSDFDLENLIRHIDSEVEKYGLNLNPDFQRGHVWTIEQEKAFIEYFLRGGRTGRDIYFNSPSWNFSVPEGEYDEYVCVDGLQRITAIRKFLNNEISAFGTYYRDFEDKIRTSTHYMILHVNDLKSREEVIQWYIDMNSGGTPHSEEEIERVRNLI